MMSGQNYGKGIRSGGYPFFLAAVRTEPPYWHRWKILWEAGRAGKVWRALRKQVMLMPYGGFCCKQTLAVVK